MKKTIQHSASVIIAIISASMILLTSTGFKLYSHHCSRQNNHHYSIFVPTKPCVCQTVMVEKSCCSQKETAKLHDNTKKNCCADKELYSKLDIHTLFNHTTINFIEWPVCVNLGYIELNDNLLPVVNHNVLWQILQEPPPPLNNSTYLSVIQVYLI